MIEVILGILGFAAFIATMFGSLGSAALTALSLILLVTRLVKRGGPVNCLLHDLKQSNQAVLCALIGLAGLLYQQFVFPNPLPIWTIWATGAVLVFQLSLQCLYRYIWIPPAKKDAEAEAEKLRLARETHMAEEAEKQRDRQARQAKMKAACSDALDKFAPIIANMRGIIDDRGLCSSTFTQLLGDRIRSKF